MAEEKKATEPPGPLSGVVDGVHYYAPGAAGGPFHLSLNNAAGRQWGATIRGWDSGAQLTWNQAPCTIGEIAGNLATRKANVIYWPLAELNGDALRADFTEL